MSTNSRNNSLLPIIFLTFFKIGGFTFGGGFAMIPLIQKEIVSRYKWLSDEEFLDTIAVTQGAPGPVAVNTAVFIGYKLAGVLGLSLIHIFKPTGVRPVYCRDCFQSQDRM